jgi:hypothetical protein
VRTRILDDVAFAFPFRCSTMEPFPAVRRILGRMVAEREVKRPAMSETVGWRALGALGRRNSCAGQTLLRHSASRSNPSVESFAVDASFKRSKL